MRQLAGTILFLMAIILSDCKKSESEDCFGASSPVDLTMINDCDSDKTVGLYQQTDNDLELLRSTKIEKSTQATICIENEGPVEDGLYIKFDNTTKLIKLQYGRDFKLNLCDSTYLTENIEIKN